MKYLAIDYGKKYIGLAVSDSAGRVAMPFSVLKNTKDVVDEIAQIVEDEQINHLVVGESKNLDGTDNPIQKDIEAFSYQIAGVVSVPLTSLTEIFTSRAAKWGVEHDIRDNPRNTNKQSRANKSESRIDDKAATILLQSYLDGLQ